MSDREIVARIGYDEHGTYKHVTAWLATLAEHDANGNRDLSYAGSVYPSDSEFCNIKATCQTDTDSLRENRENPIYCERVTWDSEFNLSEVEIAIKPLRKIAKYLDNAREVAGDYKSYGQYLVRVLKACKVKRAVIKIDGEYRITNIEYACQLVDKRIQEWRDKARELYGISV